MPMPAYPIYCLTPGCKNLADFKIAARWSDGLVSELKTYSLCCESCLPASFQASKARQQGCRLLPNESFETPGIYELRRGQRDQALRRREDLEHGS